MSVSLKRLMVLALLLAAAPLARAQEPEADDATLRARARNEWYNETSREREGRGEQAGRSRGLWSPEFRRFMMEAAARERARWGALIPGNGGWQDGVSPFDRAEAGGASWLNLGPTKADYIFNGSTLFVTDAGRVRSIVPHPTDANTLYVAFSGGGVWKTINGGTTWSPLTEALGSLSTGSLVMDPSNPNTLYLGLGDPFDGTGIGLVKSTDGGSSWSSPLFLGNSTIIPQVFIAPSNPAIVLAATDAGLYRSTNSGGSYSLVPIATGQANSPYVWSIASTGGPNLVMALQASPGNNSPTGQIWYSGDNGATWAQSMNVPAGASRMTVAAAPSSPNVVYAMVSNSGGNLLDILRSTSGGQFWRALRATAPNVTYSNLPSQRPSQIFNTQGWYDQMIIVNPANPDELFFGGALHTGKVLVGSALGARDTWVCLSQWFSQFGFPYVHADAHAAAFDAAGNLYFGTDGGIFKSTNNGASWTDTMNVGITTHLIYHLGSSTVNRSLIIGGFQDNGTRTRSGATSTFNQTIGGDGFGCDVNASDPSKVLGSLYNTRIQKSVNGGINFSAACSGIPGCPNPGGPFITRIVPWEGSATGDVVLTHHNTVVYKSANYADSWTGTTAVPANTIRNIGVAQSNQNIVGVVTSGGHYYLSTNGGSSWTEFAALPNNGLSLSHIWFDRVDPNIVYIASVAPDQTRNHLWKSVNFGTTWTPIDGGGFPTGVPVNVVKTDPGNPNILYAGTHLGVYRSDNAGANWFRYGSGMPLVEITDVYVSADTSLVRASTFGRGFWELIP